MAAKKTTALATTPSDDPLTKQMHTGAIRLKTQVDSVTIRDEKSCEAAAQMLVEVKRMHDSVEARRKEFVQPLKEQAKKIDAFFKDISVPLDAAMTELKRKTLIYREAQAKKAAEEQRKRDAEAAAAAAKAEELRAKAERAKGKKARELERQAEEAEEESLAAATQSITLAPTKSVGAGVTAYKRWTFEVTDIAKVPREYLEVNEGEIRRAVNSGLRNIPGVRIFETETLRAGGIR